MPTVDLELLRILRRKKPDRSQVLWFIYQFGKISNKSRPRIQIRNAYWHKCSKGQIGKIHKSMHLYDPLNSTS